MHRYFLIKIFVILIILANVNLKAICQVNSIKKTSQPTFYLFYNVINNSLSMVGIYPTFRMIKTDFIYTENNYLGGKKEIDTICRGTFKQTSVDSIIQIIKDLKDTIIFKINPCLISGSIRYLTVANGMHTTRFTLTNTFDYTALKIINIINAYLPFDKKIRVSEKLIEAEEDCWAAMMMKDNKNKK